MRPLIGMLMLISAVGMLFVFVTFKPSPDTYSYFPASLSAVARQVPQVNATDLGKSLPVVSDVKLTASASRVITKPSFHKESSTVASGVKIESAKPLPISKTTRVKSSWSKKAFDMASKLKTPVPGERNIFFIESSCAVGGRKKEEFMNPRQGCAVESAALKNPNATVYFLNTCLDVKDFGESHASHKNFVREVFRYPNVKSFNVELRSYFANTPLHEWLKGNHLEHSSYPVEHASDVLRLITLWKFGGMYLDLDFVVVRSLDELKKDFTVAESDTLIGNSVLGFSTDELGHAVVDDCLKEVLDNFDGQQWGYNGPYLISRVLSRLCNEEEILNMTPEMCKGFTVYPPRMFFPFYYPSWRLLFNEDDSAHTMALVLKEGTHAVHAWNKMSHQQPIRVGSKQPYALLASQFCPRVYSAVGDTF